MSVAEADRVIVQEDIVFGTGGGRELRCDVYRPPAAVAKETGVLIIHGGGWRQGNRKELRGYGILLGRLGYPCVSTEYRLTDEAPWPAQIHDVKACLRWMKANASDLGINPAKIVVEGNSAGGHLSLMVAGTANLPAFEGDGGNAGVDTSVTASIAFYPPTDLDRSLGRGGTFPDGTGPIDLLMGPDNTAPARAAASPLTHAKAGHPPTLLMHGNADEVVSSSESTRMYEALEKAGVPVEMHIYAQQPHAFDSDPFLGRQSASIMAGFINRLVD
jgi:acetyl esterase/lipase